MTIVIVPPYPQRNDPNFATIADSWNAQLPTWTDQVNATATDVTNKQALAAQSVVDCQSQVTLATNQAVLAQGYKNDTLILSEATASTANVTKWISGTTYAEGVNSWSPSDYHTYRRKTNGAGTTDPSLDTTNWEPVYVPAAMILLSTAIANNVATVDFTGLNSIYKKYIVEIISALPVYTGSNNFLCQAEVSGSWQADSYIGREQPSSAVSNNASIYNSMSSKVFTNGNLHISDVSNTTRVKPIISEIIRGGYPDYIIWKNHYYNSTAAVTGLRFVYTTGNILSGTFKLYGLK